ncbi:MAG: DegT/DnrJ/EryC1/StrS family aminotransferase [bacterium]|nr:DegT/DnrJ/EryC1/StrS family aminotransferase [bacterium]
MKNIPSAGPWITDLEIKYVTDAVKNGWYSNWSYYLDKFEEAFSKYIGVKHAISTSSCTGALTLIFRALGIKPGDEVIAPEVTWIASISGAANLGAKIVFVDVEPDTWCMDPEKFKNAITNKTKAVIPVDMFGHPADKDAIIKIANEHGIKVIEDSAPSLGSKYNNKMCGSFGLAGAFSFQGAKTLVTGEGGMLVTDDDDFYEKCYYYWDHCREPDKILYNTDFGYKFKMTNLQAALGLAQLERADEIINKRRTIFKWYKERLGVIEGLSLNAERENCFNNFYVPTIILDKEFNLTALELINDLEENNIASRPFFRPISKILPMVKDASTPVADHLGKNGINLPCASMITEEEVDYVSNFIIARLRK